MTERRRRLRLHPVSLPEAVVPWAALELEMKACVRCHLASLRHQVVVYRGAPRPWVLFIGEAPGKEEDASGLPFVGRAGRILDRAVAASGLRPRDWGVTNVIMCRPPQNRFDRRAAAACRPWLEAKFGTLDPRVLVTLGTHALEAFAPEELPISRAAGHAATIWGRTLFPMLHPASTLHSKRYGERWRDDWARFAVLLPSLRPDPFAEGSKPRICSASPAGGLAPPGDGPGRALPLRS
ncbi:MAG: uracil-DNA glycosylase [Euryarchaeota archaeon]|nr:uracil-DNA glycosylase [Euryarchaeota archaeon]MDE1879989.1 uracil-DNA glycosylase [Euryarchaeota archaeon]MDE2044041.1 uracil-DNA glycosylase [Thermoplasmata archaeon]